MFRPFYILYFTITFLFISCKGSDGNHEHSKSSADNLNAEIIHSSGELLDGFKESGVATFFNLAQFTNLGSGMPKLMVLGPRLKLGTKVNLKPIALIEFSKDSVYYQYIVANNLDEKLSGITSLNYLDFSINELSTKNLIENWFRLNCSLGNCSRFEWQNDFKLRSMIESKLINSK